ncbi:MAG: hypothetical protein Q9167_005548 [Letrouitia subvulpina]
MSHRTKRSPDNVAQESLQDATVPGTSSATDCFNAPPEGSLSSQSLSSIASSESSASLEQLNDDLEECVSCLVRLVPALRDPAPQDMYKEYAPYDEANKDINLARKMFPKANPSLHRRLGFANRKRRQALLSLKPYDINESVERSSIGNRLQDHNLWQSPNTDAIESGGWTAAFSQYHSLSDPGSCYTGTASINDSVFSKPDYFSSHSMTSVAGSDQIITAKRLDVPKPPVILKPGNAFDCPFCGQEIICGLQLTSDEDWITHVFLDLEPYICIFGDCLCADRTFGVREDWFQHELDYHRLRKIWSCQSCNHNVDEVEDMELHLGEKHKISADNLSLIVALCEKYSDEGIPNQACPFCGCHFEIAKILEEHIADHMEQFALTSIQTVHGSDQRTFEATSSENETKLARFNDFIKEQRGYLWKPPQKSFDDRSAASHVAFAEDSEDEVVDQKVHISPAESAAVRLGGRPPMKRRGDSWMSKVSTYLDNQPVDQLGKEPWRSKVQNFLETQSVEGEMLKEEKFASPVESTNHLDLKISQQESILPTLSHCFRTRPPPRDKDFVGRDFDLLKLHECLSQPGSFCVLSGAGGMGKTGTAIEFTYRYESCYSYIFWISAETAISCADTYGLIATEFLLSENDTSYEQSRLITLGQEFLEQTEKRWLLVFDNTTSWSDIQRYIPTQPHKTSGSILVTSRMSDSVDFTALPQCQLFELQALTLEESRKFLLHSVQLNPEDKGINSHTEYKIAGVIAKEAEGIPLALSHIAGYVQVSNCTLTDFVELWNERRRHTKSSTLATPNKSADKALKTVWGISLREVTIDARELLNILAFLDSDNIQQKLIVGEHEEPFLDFLHSDQSFRYKRMISELSRRNIISVRTQDDEESLSIHRSLQQKVLQDLADKDPQKLEEVFSQAFALVRKRFPLPSPIQVPEPTKWPACKEFLPHVLHLENIIINIMPSIPRSIKVARLLSDGGINLWERGMTSEGLRLLKSAETVLDALDGDEAQLRANINVVISLLIQDYGLSHMAESKDRILKALRIRLDYLNQSTPENYTRTDDILLHNAWSDYGCVLLQYNNYEEAEPIFQNCFAKYLQWGSEAEIPYEHYKYNHHSAFCRLYRHDFAGAIKLAEEGLRFITLATGQSSATSKTRFDLACIVFQSGDTERALALHKEVLEWNLRQHGKFNFLTLQSYYAVGALSAHNGSLDEAEYDSPVSC